MPLTRDQVNEVKNVADVVIKQLCQDKNVIKNLADNVSAVLVTTLNEKLRAFDTEISNLKTEIVDLKNCIIEKDKKYEQELSDLKSKIKENASEPLQVISELNEIRRRENNILIFGIPENTVNIKEFVRTLISDILPDANVPDFTVLRLGKLIPTDNKSRPVKVILPAANYGHQILKNNSKIKAMDRYRDIYVRPDQTIRQREYFLKLKQELNDRTAAGETNLLIKYVNGIPVIKSKNV